MRKKTTEKFWISEEAISWRFYWRAVGKDVRQDLDQCRTCVQCKPRVKLVIYLSGCLISVLFWSDFDAEISLWKCFKLFQREISVSKAKAKSKHTGWNARAYEDVWCTGKSLHRCQHRVTIPWKQQKFLLMVDDASKFVVTVPMKYETADSIRWAIWSKWTTYYLHSDQESNV